MDFLHNLFDTQGFPARWTCGTWPQYLGWVHIIADITIFLAYSAIPVSLTVVVLRRRDLPHAGVWVLFAAFILSCGITHLVEASMFYYPWYRFSALMKVTTAVVSIATAIVLVRSLPSILSMPGIHRLNTRLREALAAERTMFAELTTLRDEIEGRAAVMTARARKLDAAISSAGVVACRWEVESGAIDWQIGFADLARSTRAVVGPEFVSWEEAIGTENAAALRERSRIAAVKGQTLDFQTSIRGSTELVLRMSASPEAPVAGQPRFMIGMFRLTRDSSRPNHPD